jgi:hypothetical protein
VLLSAHPAILYQHLGRVQTLHGLLFAIQNTVRCSLSRFSNGPAIRHSPRQVTCHASRTTHSRLSSMTEVLQRFATYRSHGTRSSAEIVKWGEPLLESGKYTAGEDRECEDVKSQVITR